MLGRIKLNNLSEEIIHKLLLLFYYYTSSVSTLVSLEALNFKNSLAFTCTISPVAGLRDSWAGIKTLVYVPNCGITTLSSKFLIALVNALIIALVWGNEILVSKSS